ncbi:MAG: phosphatidylserine decarboxylase, partial [Anaeroplasmataceae bacterium]|nr:phosphatidylserine decarboxylase [Anaeroplasmataceae bacterium]
MNSRISKIHIKHFAKKNHILLEDYALEEVHSFNDFFVRKIKDGKRKIDFDSNIFISPCDSKLSVYKIEENSIFNIKDAYYKVSDLIENEDLALEYKNGYCLVFRLGVSDYHRYCYIDDGTQEKNISIPGVFHT